MLKQKIKILSSLGLLFFTLLASAQHEVSIWYFGNQVALDFNTYPMKSIQGYSYSHHGLNSTLSNTNGKMLFHSFDYAVLNRENKFIHLFQEWPFNEDKLIIKKPGINSLYYNFSKSHAAGNIPQIPIDYKFLVHVIDQSLDSGRGAIISSNFPYLSKFNTSSFDLTYSSNKKDIWLLALKNIPYLTIVRDSLFLFKIDSVDIRLHSIQLLTHPLPDSTNASMLKFSAYGNMFMFNTDSANYSTSINGTLSTSYLYDFDINSGQISNGRTLFGSYRVQEFSENDSFIYLTKNLLINGIGKLGLYQVNTNLLVDSCNLDSLVIPLDTVDCTFCEMQYAPDGSIIIHRDRGLGYLARINNPNLPCPDCDYEFDAIKLNYGQTITGSFWHGFNGYIFQSRLFKITNCFQDSTELHSAFIDEDSVLWDFGDGTQLYGPSSDIKHLYADTGTYRYALIRPGKDTLFNYAQILGLKPAFLGNDTLLFSGDTLSLKLPVNQADNWTWSDASSDSVFKISTPGEYGIKINQESCTSSDSLNVYFVDKLKFQNSLCLPDSLLLTYSSPKADTVFVNASNRIIQDTSYLQFSNAGTYPLAQQYVYKGLNRTLQDSIKVIEIVKPQLGNDSIFCLSESINLNLNTGLYDSLRWMDGNISAQRTFSTSGALSLEVFKGQCSATDSVNLYFFDCALFAQDTCFGDSAKFWMNLGDSVIVDWSGDLGSQSLQGNDTFKRISSQTGSATVKADIQFKQTTKTLNKTVLIPDLPISQNIFENELCKNVFFTPYTDTLGFNFFWNHGSSYASFIPDTSKIYYLKISQGACSQNDSFLINLKDCECEVWIPNAFTPNKDLLNEGFAPVGECLFQEYSLQIFNRWGEIIFKSEDPNELWDGKHQGKPCIQDVYYYKFKARTSLGEQIDKKGSITLLRALKN